MRKQLILASQSPARLELLKSVNLVPHKIIPANIDESEGKMELPNAVALRLAQEKCKKVCFDTKDSAYIIAADSVAACGRRILPKALDDQMVRSCLELLSGRRHKIYSGVAISYVDSGEIVRSSSRLVETVVQFKKLTNNEIDNYVLSHEGINKAGGYSIQGLAQIFISFIRGSYSNVVGLPLHEVYQMLTGLGYFSS